MRESYQNPSPSRLGLRSSNSAAVSGEIVEVQGGHIVRSTGRKDRHSKVCTAKGPRDRRVRLAAHTAIQFYDVQDRLGYDRPSKAVDWLIKKAKAAIDELAELPAWHPTAAAAAFDPDNAQNKLEDETQQRNDMHRQADVMISNDSGSSSKRATMAMLEENEQQDLHIAGNSSTNAQITSFLPPSLDSDAIADTIKSFFPMGAAGETSSSAMQFHNFSTHDLLSRNSNNTNSQDLRLSLQSFQDPILHHHHNQFFTSSQRGPLQSSNTPSLRAWMDPPSSTDHHYPGGALPVYPPSISGGIGFGSGYGGFSGFHIPVRIQGDEEEHDGYSDKPSSASSDSRH